MSAEGLHIPFRCFFIKIFFGIASFFLVGFVSEIAKNNIIVDYIACFAMIFLYITVIFADTWKGARFIKSKDENANPHFGHVYAGIFSLIQFILLFLYYLAAKGKLNFFFMNLVIRFLYSPFMVFFPPPVENAAGLPFFFFWVLDYVVVAAAYYMGIKNKKVMAKLLDKLIGIE
ncbi:MAG: hypothetical protein GX196_04850 [Clostridiaceae bacterium]|nr:hypothetical protein [Clostridiaceae bacterium]